MTTVFDPDPSVKDLGQACYKFKYMISVGSPFPHICWHGRASSHRSPHLEWHGPPQNGQLWKLGHWRPQKLFRYSMPPPALIYIAFDQIIKYKGSSYEWAACLWPSMNDANEHLFSFVLLWLNFPSPFLFGEPQPSFQLSPHCRTCLISFTRPTFLTHRWLAWAEQSRKFRFPSLMPF